MTEQRPPVVTFASLVREQELMQGRGGDHTQGSVEQVSPFVGDMVFDEEEPRVAHSPGGRASYPIFLETDEETPCIFEEDPERRSVAPVSVENGRRASNFMAGQLARDGAAPKYSGRAEDFASFKWLFERYLNSLQQSCSEPIAEDAKIILLERVLPDREKQNIQNMQRTGKTLSCQSVLATMEARWGLHWRHTP